MTKLAFQHLSGKPRPLPRRRVGGSKYDCDESLKQACRMVGPLEVDAVGVAQEAVADGVGEVGIANAGIPLLGRELTGEKG